MKGFPLDHGVIIVGAGPAGLSTSLHLAQLAPELASRTLILERARHPRPKLCAGGLMPGAEAWLRKLGLDPGKVPSVEVREVHFMFESRGFAFRREPFVFRVVRRDEFDAWLADAARARGLALQENTPVRRVYCLEDAVEVETDRGTYRASVVVGADGATSVVRRAIARQQTPQVARLLETLVPAGSRAPLSPDLARRGRDEGRPAPAEASQPRPDLRVHFVPRTGLDETQALFDFSCMADGVQGYVWDFPTQVREQPMRTQGIFDSRIQPQAPRASLNLVLQDRLAGLGTPPDDCQVMGHPLRWFHLRTILAVPRVLLVGDAAGVDPLFGEGISFALGYGELAARELRDVFAHGDFSFWDYRYHVLNHAIGRSLRRRAAVARLAYRTHSPRLLRFLWWNLAPLVGWLPQHFLVDWGQ